MTKKYEEPLFIDARKSSPDGEEVKSLENDIRTLCKSQPFAVLATQGTGITNASLISYAVSCDLKFIVFATPINTGKFDLISAKENVSVLVDDRSLHQENINEISALTIVGKARILSNENEILTWANLLTKKHPNLKTFVKAQTTSLILIEVLEYLYVNKFQDVRKWDPK